MKAFISCVTSFLILMAIVGNAFAGTVDNPTLSPASSSVTVGTTGEITFSALNDKPFPLKEFSAKIKYDDGLVVSDLVATPSAIKAEVSPKRNLITLEWENVPPNTELKAVFKTAAPVGTYSVRPWRILYLDYSHNRFHGACNTAMLNVTPPPLYPAISNVTASNITPNSATISWTTDQPTTGLVEYGPTTSYASTVTDSNQATNHSVTLSNFSPGSAYHFKITATNGSGLSSATGDNTFTTSNIITIKLTSPVEGETITRPDVNVTGTIVNVTGDETGVKVNGVPATVYGNEFNAGHVPLQPGQNTITATAVDTAGNTATATATITAVAGGNYIKLSTNAESGIAPLETTLRVDGSFVINAPSITNTGPGPVEVLSSSPDEYRVKLTTEGIYNFTASATGPDVNTYQDTVTITVLSKAVMDALLKAKWEGMKAALAAGNIEAALNYFVSGTKDRYQQIFTSPNIDVPNRLLEIKRIEINSIRGQAAQGSAIRTETDGEYAYPISYVHDENGIWKILGF